MSSQPCAIVTGAASGIGRATARGLGISLAHEAAAAAPQQSGQGWSGLAF